MKKVNPPSEVAIVAGNTPGQVRGEKAKLWPFPRRGKGLIRTLNRIAKKADTEQISATLAEFSSRSARAFKQRKRWKVSRAAYNDIFGRFTIGNAGAWKGQRSIDKAVLKHTLPRRIRNLSTPVWLMVTAEGNPYVLIAAHVPTKRAASFAKRQEIVRQLVAYTKLCNALGLTVVIAGDFNGSHLMLPWKSVNSRDVQHIFVIPPRHKGEALDSGVDTDSAGTITDHTGMPWVVIEIEGWSGELPELPRVPPVDTRSKPVAG